MNSLHFLNSHFGLHNPRDEWLREHENTRRPKLSDAVVATDISDLSVGGLPWKLSDAHDVALGLNLLVQIEDIINIGASNPRAATGACVLQAVLSDGGQEFVAIEHRALRGKISMRTLPGTKLVLSPETRVRRGRVLLTPDTVRVLGSPSADIWGTDTGAKRRAEALREAGLPAPSASTFDAIAAKGTVAPMGLADAAITEDEPEQSHDDDQFWAAAVAVADAQVLDSQALTSSTRAISTRPQQEEQEQEVQEVQVVSPPVSVQQQQQINSEIIIDSDDSVEATSAQPVVCPLHYLSEDREGATRSTYRLFTTRARMKGTTQHFELKMCVDDGSAVRELVMSQNLVDRCTGGLTSHQIVDMARTESPDELKRFKTFVRQNVTMLHGFALVEYNDDAPEVQDVVALPPDSEAFISQMVTNLEQRWDKFEEKNRG